MCQCGAEIGLHSPELYYKLLDFDDPLEEHKIVKDLKRTMPELKLFMEDHESGMNKLFNVLKAYSCYDNEIGYA